ncbi:MAG TPA: hypothetical protein VKU82_07065 [Planctomycetaceae bacterium]|nr:hypothetical protein [Planctomycetaceae bacterium]
MVVMVFAALLLFGIGDTLMKLGRDRSEPRGTKTVVETNAGNLTEVAIRQMQGRRSMIHRFIAMAYQAVSEKPNPYAMQNVVGVYGFGGVTPREVVFAWLQGQEARKLGIKVTDKQIDEYIDKFTGRKLSSKKFREIIDDLHIGGNELFDMFRNELQAQIAIQLKAPQIVASPERYWEYYQQLNTREKIEVAALPVSDFTDKVPEPSESQVAELFEKHKADIPKSSDAEYKPGFRQPRKVKIQYLALSRARFEEQLLAQSPITDEDIEEYYERNKALDPSLQEPPAAPIDDSTPIEPEFAPEKGPSLDSPRDETPDEAAPPGENDQCGGNAGEPSSDGEDDSAAEPPDGEPSANPSDDESAGKKDDGEKSPQADENASAPTSGASAPPKAETPKTRYKPLDDELRDVIRDKMVEQRVVKVVQEQSRKIVDAMRDVGLKFAVSSSEIKLTDPSAEQLETLNLRSEEELKKIAETFGATFGQTGLVSAVELSEIPGIGDAREAGRQDERGTSTVDVAFATEALCRVFEAEGPNTFYICWKVQDSPSHIPKFTEPGIREQVVTAWKRLHALPLAKERAEELAERVRTSGKEFVAALEGQTVNGDSRGPALNVSETDEFSYWREPAAPNIMARESMVQLGNPIFVNNPGQRFMEVVFNELAEGEVGSALNDDASVYYVVKVASRRIADRDGFKLAPVFSGFAAYAPLAEMDQRRALADYFHRLDEKYAVKWHDVSSRDTVDSPLDEE